MLAAYTRHMNYGFHVENFQAVILLEQKDDDVPTQIVKRQFSMENPLLKLSSPTAENCSAMCGQRLLWRVHCVELVDGQGS